MAEESSNLFDAVRKANRAVWEQASGRKQSEELPNPFDAVRKKNRAVWEQASGRKPSDESRAIPPPTGRESPLEGADVSAMVAALSAKLSALEARVDYIEDDFPEHQDSSGNESAATWSGRVMSHDGVVIAEWDVSDPDNITGEYIRYDGVAGDAAFTDEPDEIYLCWHVADKAEAPATGYTLSTDTSGDIVLPVPKEWAELNVLLTDEEGIQRFKELKIKTEDPDVGLVFAKPETQEDPEEPQLLQLKTTGGKAGDVYVCGEDGAASWETPSIALKQVGADGLKVVLTLGETDYESAVLYGDTCGDD